MAVTPNYQRSCAGHVEGTWTHTVGTAAETYAVSGEPTFVDFKHNDADAKYSVPIVCSTSTSGNVTTITVNQDATVTSGTFVVDYIPR